MRCTNISFDLRSIHSLFNNGTLPYLHITTSDIILRPNSIKLCKDLARSKAGNVSFCFDTAKLWNSIPSDIKNAATIGIARSAIKKIARTLPV